MQFCIFDVPIFLMKAKRTTIKDIARLAGVSIGTVDRVLNNRGEVAVATSEKVMHLVQSLDYKPNLIARALTSKKNLHIAVLLPSPTHDNRYWAKHVEGIDQMKHELEEYGANITLLHFDLHDGNDFSLQAQLVKQLSPDGVIFAPILRAESLVFAAELDALGIPYIFIDTDISDARCLGFIGEDAYQSGRMAASLVDFGIESQKDVLMVNIARDMGNTQHLAMRNQGFMSYFMDSARNTGLKITLDIHSANPDLIYQRLKHVLDNHSNIGAIWVSSAKTYVVARCLEQLGHRHLVVVGYEVYDENVQYLKKKLVHFLIAQNPVKQSRKAVRNMFQYLSSQMVPMRQEYKKIEIVNSENLRFFI